MKNGIVHRLEPVTLIGGGDGTLVDVAEALALAPTCVAADGGARLALSAGADPVAVIGDFDSLDPDTRSRIPADRQFPIAEQDSTDFEKALSRIDAPLVLAVGFTGARIDHQLGVLHVLVRYPDRPCIVIGPQEILLVSPPEIELPCLPEETVSIFPMGRVSGASRGLRWPVDGLVFDPMTQIGTLNAAEGPVWMRWDAPAAVLVLPRRLLGYVTRVLASAPSSARWPARAELYRGPQQS
ncbi:thiamine diphosphokinase [uncultured Tateyamaria sp.]|uniref:thiamine diphosphokinase n=1 Tax=uncultured Tateyamaria sp. TaxID=455651 RepID=UPI00261DF46D|nr:thiamine diphosphokinase [uncultured Tateyamaria sp.]